MKRIARYANFLANCSSRISLTAKAMKFMPERRNKVSMSGAGFFLGMAIGYALATGKSIGLALKSVHYCLATGLAAFGAFQPLARASGRTSSIWRT